MVKVKENARPKGPIAKRPIASRGKRQREAGRMRGDSGGADAAGDRGGGGADPAVTAAARPVSAIVIGDRARKDFGDIDELTESINQRGLLQPIGIDPNNNLVDGQRRLLAWQRSRFKDEPIPIYIDVNLDLLEAGEYDANAQRKAFALSEAVALERKIKPALEARARERLLAGRAAEADKGRAADKVAKVTGKGRRTMDKARAIVEAAESDPAKYGKLVMDMDRNGADGAYKRLMNMRQAERIRAEPPPLPGQGPYWGIAVDPPWLADLDGSRDPASRGYYPYPTMSLEDICAIDVESIAHPEGCALWLWVPNFHLANGSHVKVLDAWGFSPSSTILTWVKTGIGMGQRLRGASEHCILAVRGDVPVNAGAERTWFEAPVTEHSEKPQRFFEIVEKVTPAPRYAMLFAGKTLPPNWDGHGDRIGAVLAESQAEVVS